jgi:hypothetical protein
LRNKDRSLNDYRSAEYSVCHRGNT